MISIEKTIFYQTGFGIGIGLFACGRVAGGFGRELVAFGNGWDPIASRRKAVCVVQGTGHGQPAVCALVVERR
jgi:hypothetical protein